MRSQTHPRTVTGQAAGGAGDTQGPGWLCKRASVGQYDLYITAGRYVNVAGLSSNLTVWGSVSGATAKPTGTPVRVLFYNPGQALADAFFTFSAFAYD